MQRRLILWPRRSTDPRQTRLPAYFHQVIALIIAGDYPAIHTGAPRVDRCTADTAHCRAEAV